MNAGLWPKNGVYIDWRFPVAKAVELLTQMISQVVFDNGQDAINAIFLGKKAIGVILYLVIFPPVARNPLTGNAVVVPIKVLTLVEIVPVHPLSAALHTNRVRQRRDAA